MKAKRETQKAKRKTQRHTPGPWRIVIDGTMSGRWPFIVAGEEEDALEIAELETVKCRGIFRRRYRPWKRDARADEIEANARLMCAAPELLEACKMLLALGSHNREARAAAETAVILAEHARDIYDVGREG